MQAISEVVLNRLIDALGAILLGLLCGAIRYIIAWIKTRISDEKLQAAISELESAVLDGVYFTEQTVVKTIKQEGGWTDEAKQQAKNACVEYVNNMLSSQSSTLLQTAFNSTDLTNLIANAIEATLGKMHDTYHVE